MPCIGSHARRRPDPATSCGTSRQAGDRPRASPSPASRRAFPACGRCTMSASTLYPGEVTALIGENGAGKSTLVKILTGIYQPDAGDDRASTASRSTLPSAHAAFGHGITAIHQETVLFDDLTRRREHLLGHAPRTRFGTIDWRDDARERAATCSTRWAPAYRRRRAAEGPRHRQQASRRGRARHVDRRADRHHGRADRGACRTRRSRSSSCSSSS